MGLDDPVIITCSISGAIANRDQCPAIPYTPEEYAAEARRIVDEGGAMIHIHARRPDGTPSFEIEDFRAITEAIRAEVDDVSINYSTVFTNPFYEIIELLTAMNECQIKPEHECFDVGHVGSLAPLIDMGVLHP